MGQREMAERLRALHEGRPLVLPNAWDAASARVIESAGAAAIATTSAGVSWAFGRGDGQTIGRDAMVGVVRAIVETVGVPVTADVEGGYGDGTADDVAATVRAVIAAGAAGVNLEDSPGRDGATLLDPEAHAERVGAARAAADAAGGDLVINARTDVYLMQVGAPETRFDEAVARANRYRAAGADCLFVPGVVDEETIGRLARAVDGPLNVMAMPGAPSVARLAELGVARVSLGPFVALAALGATRRLAVEILERGTYGSPDDLYPFAELNGSFARRS